MQLRIDGKLIEKMGSRGITLPEGGRILRTTAPGGIQIEFPGGTDVVITPGWWAHYQVWYLNIDVRHARANQGVLGAIRRKTGCPRCLTTPSLEPGLRVCPSGTASST